MQKELLEDCDNVIWIFGYRLILTNCAHHGPRDLSKLYGLVENEYLTLCDER